LSSTLETISKKSVDAYFFSVSASVSTSTSASSVMTRACETASHAQKSANAPRSDVTQFQEATQFHIYMIQSEELSKLYYSIELFEAPVRPT
jgi:hypothetical protein